MTPPLAEKTNLKKTSLIRVKCQSITCLLEIQARFPFLALHKIKMSK